MGGGNAPAARTTYSSAPLPKRRALARRTSRTSLQKSRYVKNRRRLLLMLTRKRAAENTRRAKLKKVNYRIKRGDTVTRISKKLRIAARHIINANGSSRLIAGRTITIRYYR
jgi:nucleoid-associated protein YgaU